MTATREEAEVRAAQIREALRKAARLQALVPLIKEPRRPSIYTYFIQVEDPNLHAGPIKIGCAGDPVARLAQLQTAHPYKLWLMGYLPGGEELERELHEKYSHLHLRGEWFRATEDLERDLYGMVYDYKEGLR